MLWPLIFHINVPLSLGQILFILCWLPSKEIGVHFHMRMIWMIWCGKFLHWKNQHICLGVKWNEKSNLFYIKTGIAESKLYTLILVFLNLKQDFAIYRHWSKYICFLRLYQTLMNVIFRLIAFFYKDFIRIMFLKNTYGWESHICLKINKNSFL